MKKEHLFYGHFIDHEHKTVIVGRDFIRCAGKYGTEEYFAFVEIRADFPDYEVKFSDFERRGKIDA